ncbi:conserved hypothetical protein [Beggiatoa sp. PS]|nr:conserved hypothetical protein [Beggiatoa sp. PS]
MCFTDNYNLTSTIWNIVNIDFRYKDPRRTAKAFKLFPHILFPKYELSIWIDGSCVVTGNIMALLNTFCTNSSMSCFPHPKRNCIYDEAKACMLLGKDEPSVIKKQMNLYLNDGYPKKNGLISGGILIRRHHNTAVIKMMEDWWQQIDELSVRDLLSFNYVAWINGFHCNILPLKIFENPFFSWKVHPNFVFYDRNGKEVYSIKILASLSYLKFRNSPLGERTLGWLLSKIR